jgi:hypothetical protein
MHIHQRFLRNQLTVLSLTHPLKEKLLVLERAVPKVEGSVTYCELVAVSSMNRPWNSGELAAVA